MTSSSSESSSGHRRTLGLRGQGSGVGRGGKSTLTLKSRGLTGLGRGADGRVELLQPVSLHAEPDHVLQPHLVWAVDHVLVILQEPHVTTTQGSGEAPRLQIRPLTSNSEGAPEAWRTPCTLWYPSGAWVRDRSLSRRSLQRPRATSQTRRSREPSVWLGCEYLRLVLERHRGSKSDTRLQGRTIPHRPEGVAEVDPAAQVAHVRPLDPVMLHTHARHQKTAERSQTLTILLFLDLRECFPPLFP